MKILRRFFSVSRFTPALLLFCIAIIISFITRIALLISFGKEIDSSFLVTISSFIIGLVYDMLVAALIIFLFILQIAFTNDYIYTKKGRIATIILFLLLLFMLLFTKFSPKDYNKDLFKGTLIYVGLRLIIFLFLGTQSINFRYRWRSAVLKIFFFITCFALIFNGVSEWFFWEEFSSRYNF
ncbi:MAG: LTA synthase family protein, partial [Bacteroidota bacterium]